MSDLEQVSGMTSGKSSGGGRLREELLFERIWKVAIVGILFAVLFRQEILRLLERWLSDPRESHGLLIPAFSLYFLYQKRKQLREAVGQPSYWGLVLICLSVAGYLFSFFKGFYYPRQIMLITLMAGVVLLLGGWPILRVVWLPVVFLIFAMPLPARFYTLITMPMREMASTVASVVLSGFPDVTCESQGVVIYGRYGGSDFSLNVAEACSGMRLLLAFMALGVAMAYLDYRPVIHRFILMCSTIPIAIFCNVVRVLLTGMISIYLGTEYATGLLHTILGMLMLLLAFGLYGLLAWIMNHLFVEEDEGQILLTGLGGDQ